MEGIDDLDVNRSDDIEWRGWRPGGVGVGQGFAPGLIDDFITKAGLDAE
ncbi:hypothetical protein [Streptomyces sp. NPDC049915]